MNMQKENVPLSFRLLQEAQQVEMPKNWEEMIENVSSLADQCFACEVVDLAPFLSDERILKIAEQWWKHNQPKLVLLSQIKDLIDEIIVPLSSASERASARYKVEYASWKELEQIAGEVGVDIVSDITMSLGSEKTNYSFWSPMLDPILFAKIVGEPVVSLAQPAKKILNIGAGSGQFEQMLLECGVKSESIRSVDISQTSVVRLQEMGCESYQGRIEQIPEVLKGEYDLISLSYFIDRDENQRSTIRTATRLLKPNGKLVLEGLLPAILLDSGGVSYIDTTEGLVTKGRSAEEDLVEIAWSFLSSSKEQGIQLQIERLCCGFRYVYSRDGLEVLPGYFVVAKRIEENGETNYRHKKLAI